MVDGLQRPVGRYFGSKWRLARQHIVGLLPPHQHYVEPFAGSAAVLLNKAPSMLETYNDADGRLVNFFRVLRDDNVELIRRIELTPFARAELSLAREQSEDSIEDARRFYVLMNQQYGGPVTWLSGWRLDKHPYDRRRCSVGDWCDTSHLMPLAWRMRKVQIECDDALDVIARYDRPNTCFYVDPPYLGETRSDNRRLYLHEYNTEAQHRDLSTLLHQVKGSVLLSGYPSELYDELYADWEQVRVESRTQGSKCGTEVIWLSPNAQEARSPIFAECTLVQQQSPS